MKNNRDRDGDNTSIFAIFLDKRTSGINEVRKNLMPGDIVPVIDDISPRSSWPIGQITETLPGSRGCVGRILVKTKSNILERRTNKLLLVLLCLLQEVT